MDCTVHTVNFNCPELLFVEAAPAIAMTLHTRIPRARLAKGADSPPVIWSIISAHAEDALLVVDTANSSLKRVRLASAARDVRVLYRSSGGYSLRGAALVAAADAQSGGRTRTLLLAEMQSDARVNTMAYSLVVAELRDGDGTCTPAQRFALDSAPSARDDDSFASLCAVRDTSRVLCAVSGSASLDAFAVPSARAARREAPVPLGFAQYCFTCGVCDGATLLFVKEMHFAAVRILEVRDGAPLALQLLRRIGGCDRHLWSDSGLLFSTEWNAQSETHEVRVWRVSRGGRRVERLDGTPIAHADNLRINCWALAGEKLALCDAKTWDIVVYKYQLKAESDAAVAGGQQHKKSCVVQ